MGRDFYKILGVERQATQEEIRKAYKALARKTHPDKNPESAKEFSEITKAHEILSDPNKRATFDTFGEEGLQFTGLSSEDPQPEKVAPSQTSSSQVVHKISCTLEELYHGTVKKMKIKQQIVDVTGQPTPVEKIVSIVIKPGWKKGTKVSFPDTPNIAFVIDEKPHPHFVREGDNLITKISIPLVSALCGTKSKVLLLNGTEAFVEIKEVIGNNSQLVIPNQGMPLSNQESQYGDLIIRFDIQFPNELTQTQKDQLEQILGQ
eukprot:c8158_g1_i1.p2 GENE.c8158_g1_i1~~c8158_g1_i1.p2  ORF type:complete len:262 (-),score=110.35 c8158_g1_i1:60-845(-)